MFYRLAILASISSSWRRIDKLAYNTPITRILRNKVLMTLFSSVECSKRMFLGYAFLKWNQTISPVGSRSYMAWPFYCFTSIKDILLKIADEKEYILKFAC